MLNYSTISNRISILAALTKMTDEFAYLILGFLFGGFTSAAISALYDWKS